MGLQEDMAALCAANEFMNYNHITLKEWSVGQAVVELTVVEESLNPYGLPHGGALYTMGDCASGIAARSDGRRYVTLSSSLNFLRSAKLGDTIQAVAQVRHRGRSTCYVDVDILGPEGKLVASGNYTFFCIDDR